MCDNTNTLRLSGVFLEDPDKAIVKITDFDAMKDEEDIVNARISSETVTAATIADLSLHLQKAYKPRLRLISCYSLNSVSPLGLTKSMFERMLSIYQIGPAVMEAMMCLGSRSRGSETGMGGLAFERGEGGCYELSYRLTYVEQVVTSTRESWAVRQISLIQKSWPEVDEILFIICCPREDDGIENFMRQRIFDQKHEMSDWCAVHLTVFARYLPEWRRYIRYLGDRLEEFINIALTFNISETSGMGKDPSCLQELHHLHDQIICMIAWLQTSSKILDELSKLNSKSSEIEGRLYERETSNTLQLGRYMQRLHAYVDSAKVMKERVSSTLRLLEVGIQQDNHRLVSTLNRGMLGLSEITAADNEAVKTITFVTLIFLPANLVAAILGTNFFSSQNPHNSLSMSPEFWIFFAISLPLTILTIGGWICYSHVRSRKHKSDNRLRILEESC